MVPWQGRREVDCLGSINLQSGPIKPLRTSGFYRYWRGTVCLFQLRGCLHKAGNGAMRRRRHGNKAKKKKKGSLWPGMPLPFSNTSLSGVRCWAGTSPVAKKKVRLHQRNCIFNWSIFIALENKGMSSAGGPDNRLILKSKGLRVGSHQGQKHNINHHPEKLPSPFKK